jgi:EAL domain-containing protein (putative c-di-GMP-specific phosphodiesterase class I)
VAGALRASGLPPHLLELELTESLLVENVDYAMEIMHKLKALGATLSIDDFGTGYSSFAYLKRFPIDHLKLDRSFVRDLAASPKDAAIVDAICLLAQSLGMGLVAEGVEEAWQAQYFGERYCTEMQGHFFAHALAADGLVEALARSYPVRTMSASAAIQSGESLRQGKR